MSDKERHLRALLSRMGAVAVAYSGGTDSTLLLKVAHEELGEGVIALTADSPSLARRDLEAAREIAAAIGVRHVLLATDEVQDPEYAVNTPERCYFCKRRVFDALLTYARANGYRLLLDGSNADDLSDERPGRRAALERGIRSPLQEAGLTKAEVRDMARRLGLPNWDRSADACLASRVPYGTPITPALLARIEGAEAYLRGLGLRALRLRHHGAVARLEVEPADFERVMAHRAEIVAALRALGYPYVALDLAGFRSGSLNEVLRQA